MNQPENQQERPGKNPIVWVAVIVLGLIIYIFVGFDRGGKQSETPPAEVVQSPQALTEPADDLDSDVPPTPGFSAREYVREIRLAGRPFAFDELMQKAADFSSEGSLADAHILYFFGAREGHVPAMMMMAEMTDPMLFRAQNNLLDKADAVQAYKWYSQALKRGHEPARARLDKLRQWAETEAGNGDPAAQQLLLNFN